MQDIPRRLTLLEKKLNELADCEPMLVSQIEGYLAGIIICPDPIPPDEWLPLVWDPQRELDGPVFKNTRQVEKLVNLVLEHYHATVADLSGGRYAPVFNIDNRNGDVLWELWIEGFADAVKFRPDSWNIYLKVGGETAAAFSGLLALAEINERTSNLDETEKERFQADAPDKIVRWIQILDDAGFTSRMPDLTLPPTQASAPKVGRNDPCPCGSGKKYKKCCGLG